MGDFTYVSPQTSDMAGAVEAAEAAPGTVVPADGSNILDADAVFLAEASIILLRRGTTGQHAHG